MAFVTSITTITTHLAERLFVDATISNAIDIKISCKESFRLNGLCHFFYHHKNYLFR